MRPLSAEMWVGVDQIQYSITVPHSLMREAGRLFCSYTNLVYFFKAISVTAVHMNCTN